MIELLANLNPFFLFILLLVALLVLGDSITAGFKLLAEAIRSHKKEGEP